MSAALKLAKWIRGSVPQKSGPLTQLKLQKLCFYAYGAALAFRVDDEVGDVPFEAWQHGPVIREVFNEYRHHGAGDLPPFSFGDRVVYSAATAQPMNDALSVYAWLDAWQLRQQSHLEKPWINAQVDVGRRPIAREAIRDHFIEKFRRNIRLPEYLGHSSSFLIDGVPTARFESLHELAGTIRARLG